MHVPNHMISSGAEVAAAATAAAVVAAAALPPGLLRETTRNRKRAGDHIRSTGTAEGPVPADDGAGFALMMATAALVFALQMVNFPVLPGTSGHLLGGALAVALIGPRRAILAVSAVVTTQALLFADGGVGALGVNVWLIAIIPASVVAVSQLVAERRGPQGKDVARPLAGSGTVSLLTGAALGPVVAAGVLSGLYAVAGTGSVGFGEFGGPMISVHIPIGVGEAAVTAGALALVVAGSRLLRPGGTPEAAMSADRPAPAAFRQAGVAHRKIEPSAPVVWTTAALAAGGLSMLASSQPDGLSRVLGDMGIAVGGTSSLLGALSLDGYRVPGIGGPLSGSVAGLMGLGATAALMAVGLFALQHLVGRTAGGTRATVTT